MITSPEMAPELSNFEKESAALLTALSGQPIAWADVAENYTLVRETTGSANHKLGSVPAWGFDCYRRRDMATVSSILDWAVWYCTQPLHENESLSPNPAYRVRIDGGTYALAALATLAGRHELATALLARCKASVAWCVLAAFTGSARRLIADNPRPPHIPTVLVAGGPFDLLPGGPLVPYVASAGKRGWVRVDTPTGHDGPFEGMNDGHLRVLLAQAVGLDYLASKYDFQHKLFTRVRQRASLPPWGLGTVDVGVARAAMADPTSVTIPRDVHRWTLPCLPSIPFTVVRRRSGAVEFACLHSGGSSTGTKMVEVVFADGLRVMGSADNGQRGGKKQTMNIQAQDCIERPDGWLCQWTSGEGTPQLVRRPSLTEDPIVWRVNSSPEGSVFVADGIVAPPTPDPRPHPIPVPEPPPQSAGRLSYLGEAGPGQSVYGSKSSKTIVRPIHSEGEWVNRWIVEEKA